jgi:hypothetical protein
MLTGQGPPPSPWKAVSGHWWTGSSGCSVVRILLLQKAHVRAGEGAWSSSHVLVLTSSIRTTRDSEPAPMKFGLRPAACPMSLKPERERATARQCSIARHPGCNMLSNYCERTHLEFERGVARPGATRGAGRPASLRSTRESTKAVDASQFLPLWLIGP